MKNQESSNPEYLDRKDAADYLGLSPNTLDRWRCEKANLSFYKIGGAVRYKKTDLDAYAESRKVVVVVA